MNEQIIKQLGDRLYDAMRSQQSIPPLSDEFSELTIDDAYHISLQMLKRRQADGEAVVGKKIGVTSAPVQEMLGVFQPDFGFLTNAMQIPNGGEIQIADHLIQPRAEAEIAFRLKSDLKGPGVSEQDVLDATEVIYPCFEIVDSRIDDWKIKITDTVADNASCGVFVLGDNAVDPRGLDLPNLTTVVTKNGEFLSEGKGSAVQGNPLTAVAWLANTLGEFGIPFLAGEVILSGSLVPLEPMQPGDHVSMTLSGVGSCDCRFI